ncbi:MAG TPA: peptidoglycan-binding domain-containing protein [Negativicutes bacterium]|nr:peptidoglycan-binding domain-containing protein [Negativicutes bacterium]
MRAGKVWVFFCIVVLFTTSVTFADVLKNGSQGEEVKQLQSALKKKGFFNADITGYFGSMTEEAVKRFQAKNKLTADGVVGAGTKKVLFGTTAGTSSGKVELLDWWTGASKVFKIGMTAKVTDVKTGKTFNLVRTYGGNHADCEAKTTSDSKKIKEIWGGWSWDRRPVVVEVGGRKIAASMAAMPHAGVDGSPANKTIASRSGGYGRGANLDKVKSNGMSGVIDVHFLNSRTHGTNKVDKKHQAAIKIAAKSGK